MQVGKVNNYIRVGNAAACNTIELEEYEYKLHICGTDESKLNCSHTKEVKPFYNSNTTVETDEGLIFLWNEGVEPLTSKGVLHLMDCMRGKRWFIHCTAGNHRAPTISVAYLYLCLDYDFIEAVCRVNAARRQYKNISVTGYQYHELKLIQNLK